MIGRFKCILVDNIYSAEVEELIEKRWYSDPEKDGQEGSIYIYIYMFKLLLKKRNWKKMRKIKQFIFDFWIILFLWYKPWSESLTKKKKNRKSKKKCFFF